VMMWFSSCGAAALVSGEDMIGDFFWVLKSYATTALSSFVCRDVRCNIFPQVFALICSDC
jgi:hypothetical protein